MVAALTMPALISNHQKTVLATQLKKEVNTIVNDFKRILADEGVDSLCDSSFVDQCDRFKTITINEEKFANYFNLSKMPENSVFAKFLNEELSVDYNTYFFKDGSCLAFAPTTGAGSLIIDTNCDKAPNKWTLDRFAIIFDEYGNIPSIQSEYSINDFNSSLESFGGYEGLYSICQQFQNITDPGIVAVAVTYCFYSIVQNNWKIPY